MNLDNQKIIKTLLLLVLNLFSLLSYSQVTFTTNLKYNIDWKNEVQHQYYSEIKNTQPGINSSCLVKYDNRYISGFDNILVEYIYSNIKDDNFEMLYECEGGKVKKRDKFNILYWKSDVSIHHPEDTMRWWEIEEIQYAKLHQEWYLDTLKGELMNRLLGLTLVRVENDTSEVDMFYVKMKNDFSSDIINDETVVYIRQLNNKFNWIDFPKEQISKLLVDKEKSYCQITEANTSKYIGNERVMSLDSVFKDNYLDTENLKKTILENADGLNLNQLLYIDVLSNSINTNLNGIAPLLPIYDYKDVFKYYKPLYWMNF